MLALCVRFLHGLEHEAACPSNRICAGLAAERQGPGRTTARIRATSPLRHFSFSPKMWQLKLIWVCELQKRNRASFPMWGYEDSRDGRKVGPKFFCRWSGFYYWNVFEMATQIFRVAEAWIFSTCRQYFGRIVSRRFEETSDLQNTGTMFKSKCSQKLGNYHFWMKLCSFEENDMYHADFFTSRFGVRAILSKWKFQTEWI